jgi:hypothetical protein
MYKMFDADSVRKLLGMPNSSAVEIPASRPKPERNALIGDTSEYVLAKPRTRPVGLVEQEPREIGRQATTVRARTASSSPLCSLGPLGVEMRRAARQGDWPGSLVRPDCLETHNMKAVVWADQ